MTKHPLILEDTLTPVADAVTTILRQAGMLRAQGREDLAIRMEANAREITRFNRNRPPSGRR